MNIGLSTRWHYTRKELELVTRSDMPNLLQVCRESRTSVVEEYVLIDTIFDRPMYFDNHRDLLLISGSGYNLSACFDCIEPLGSETKSGNVNEAAIHVSERLILYLISYMTVQERHDLMENITDFEIDGSTSWMIMTMTNTMLHVLRTRISESGIDISQASLEKYSTSH